MSKSRIFIVLLATISTGFLAGQHYTMHAYNPKVLEELLFESVELTYHVGCTAAFIENKLVDTDDFCDKKAKEARKDYEEIMKDKIWEKNR